MQVKRGIRIFVTVVVVAVAVVLGYIFSVFNQGTAYDAYYLFRVVNDMIATHPTVKSSRTAVIENKSIWFPKHVELESHFESIREEILGLVGKYNLQEFRTFDGANANILRRNDIWRVMPLILLGKVTNNEFAAKTVSILKECCGDSGIRNAFISMIEPHTNIAPHTGNFMSVVRYHLCLYNPQPKQSYLVINNTQLNWYEGQSFMFDDMYFHGVVNFANSPRIVLFLDIVRFDLPLHLWIMDYVLHYLATFSARYDLYVHGSAPLLRQQ